jgi:hypothetical protein
MDFHRHSLSTIAAGKYEDKEKCESFRIKYFVMRTADFVLTDLHGVNIAMA